jgi:hypothetical protein
MRFLRRNQNWARLIGVISLGKGNTHKFTVRGGKPID